MRFLLDAWLVLVLSLAFGAALAGVHMSLGERIRQNQLNETLSQVPALVVGAREGRKSSRAADLFEALDAQGMLKGYVIRARGQGFADVIQVLIGVTPEVDRITGLYVLEQKETPGLGNRIEEEKWRAQFQGSAALTALTVVRDKPQPGANQVRAVTGATISSRSVCEIVNAGVRKARAELGLAKKE